MIVPIAFVLAILVAPSVSTFFNGQLATTADLIANYTVSGESAHVTYADQVLTGSSDNTSVVLADHDGSISLLGVHVVKTGDTIDNDAASFVGLNAAVVAQRGGSILIRDSVISSKGNDSNAVHVPLDGYVELLNTSLLCYNTQGHGIDVTGGTVVGHQLYIETHGASASSGISTDTGGGNISIYDSQVVTYGTGSLVAYSTGNIHLYNVIGHANNSHALGMDGRNYISARSCKLTANGAGFYGMQSFEYDMFNVGRLLLQDTSLTSTEASFLVTNSQVDAEVHGSTLGNNGTLAHAYGYDKAVKGKDGGQLKLAIYGSDVSGDIKADNISYVGLSIFSNSSWTGSFNSGQDAYWASLTFDNSTANKIVLTGDSYLNVINVFSPEYIVDAVTSNGHSIYYSTEGSVNFISFGGESYNFTGGGQLTPWVV